MKKIRKKLKGMTLVEVLIALALFTIMSSLLAGSVAMVCNISNSTNKLSKRISYEAPKAELRKDGIKEDSSASTEPAISIGFEFISTTCTVKYDKYVVTDDSSNNYDGANFKYIKKK